MTTSKSDWVVIGISGVTCSGKTTLANRLKEALWPVSVFNQDHYFFPDDSPRHVRVKGLEHNDYDILSSLDMEAMMRDVTATLEGDDRSHSRGCERDGALQLPGKRFMVVEGFTVLNYKPLLDICDLRYYLVLEYGECAARRALRLYEPPDVEGYFDTCVWPRHLRYRAQILKDPSIRVLDGTQPDVFDTVMADIKALGGTDTK